MIANETKYQKFKRLAKQRGDRVLKDLRLLGNLSNRNNYDYVELDIKKIFSAIEDELHTSKMRFKVNKLREINFQ